MYKDVSLIKVKTLTKKMAQQIEVVPYNCERFKSLTNQFRTDTLRPIAWAQGNLIDGISCVSKAWLVEDGSQLVWISAPYSGKVSESTPDWLDTCTKNLPQIFIG